MLQSVAPFRDMFGKYVFGGILDRHPGLRIGWFEGGINWVPSAIQDAAAHRRVVPAPRQPRGAARPAALLGRRTCARRSWSTRSGSSSIDRIGVDRVMWSTDFPHNESTYGYSNESLADGRRRGRRRARPWPIVGGNITRFLGLDG